MKALFVSNDCSIFDPGSATRERMRSYAAAIGELHIVSRAPEGALQITEGPLTLHPVVAGKLFYLGTLEKKIRELTLAHGIEVVSAQDPFEHGRAAMRAIRGVPAKLHLQIHTDFLSPWFVRSGVFRSMKVPAPAINRVRLQIASDIIPRADGVRAVSERVASSVSVTYGVPMPSVVPVPVSTDLPAPLPLPPHNFSFAFLTCSRLAPEKRIEDILMALGRLGLHHDTVGLVIIGDGPERKKLEELTAKLGLTQRVLFMGEQKDARAYMASANAYIQASAYEGYGRTLIEAALARIPIITTDVGIVGEVLKGYEDVLSTPPGDTANLAAHMEALIRDHQLRLSLVMNAEHSVRNHLAAYPDIPAAIAEDLTHALAPRQ